MDMILLIPILALSKEVWSHSCPRCRIPRESHARSSNRDVIMMMIAKKFGRIDLNIRSLRSTGCKARVIIFVDSALRVEKDFLSLTEDCGCEVDYINLTDQQKKAPHLARFQVYKQWLDKNIRDVDRVMHIDAFDTFFQHDPFNEGISHNALDIVLEDKKIGDCPWNSNWLEKCYGPKIRDELGRDVIACSGSIGGNAKLFKKLLKILVSLSKFKQCWNPSIDQAHLNYLLYTGRLERAHIPVKVHGCNSSFLTMTWCSKKRREIDHTGLLLNPAGEEPALVHQYNRYKEVIEHYERICPRR